MRETAIMDFVRAGEGGPAWAPTAEKVLDLGELGPSGAATPGGGAPGGPPSGPGPGTDLDSLGDLTYAELARARGLDPDAVVRLSGLQLPRPGRPAGPVTGSAPAVGPVAAPGSGPTSGPEPATSAGPGAPAARADGEALGAPGDAPTPRWLSDVVGAAGDRYSPAIREPRPRRRVGAVQTLMTPVWDAPAQAPAPPSAPELPTWPPPGAVVESDSDLTSRPIGPVPSRHRPRSRSRWWPAVAGALVVAVVAAGVWSLLGRSGKAAPPKSWDPRVVPAASFVAAQTHLDWRHPVAVSFLDAHGFAARFGAGSAAEPRPAGGDEARWVPAAATVYVAGPVLTLYSQVGLLGALTEALAAQDPGVGPPEAVVAAADRVQTAYQRSLSPRQRAVLSAEERSAG